MYKEISSFLITLNIRFVHDNQEYYGVAKVKYIPAPPKSSGIIDTSSSTLQPSQLFLLIKPKAILPKLNSTSTIMVSIKEDSTCTQTFKVDSIYVFVKL